MNRLCSHEALIVGLIGERKDITLNEMVERLAVERSACIGRSLERLASRARLDVQTRTGAGPPRRPEARLRKSLTSSTAC